MDDLPIRQIARYGWRPDLPDARDYLFSVVHRASLEATLPPKVSLRAKMPPAFDQGQLGSCTANALNLMWAFVHGGGPYSRLHTYYYERLMEGTIDQDAGAEIRDGIKVLATNGVGPEAEWPYDVAKYRHKPAAREIADAKKDRCATYARLTTGADFRACLAAGFPFCIGFTVYESFEGDAVAKTGLVPMPASGEPAVGGHAVCVIGYDRTRPSGDVFEVRNSWGSEWGDQGNFWIPAGYLTNTNLADDAWTIRK